MDPVPQRLVSLLVVLVSTLAALTLGAGSASAAPAPTELEADERAAVAATDEFWRRNFSELFGRPYTSPEVAGPYFGTEGPTCGGEPSIPLNAVYCRPGDFVAWDRDLMALGHRQIGDAWVYLIIAHEWGHAIQARLARDLVSQAAELQADCLAGAAIAGAARDGLIVLEPGDQTEIGRTLIALADDVPWTNERDHGDAGERVTAFNTGANLGVPACV